MWKQMVDLGVALELGWLLDIGSSSNSIYVEKGVLSISSTAGMSPVVTLPGVLHGVDPFPFLLPNVESFFLRRSFYTAHIQYHRVTFLSSRIPVGEEVGVYVGSAINLA